MSDLVGGDEEGEGLREYGWGFFEIGMLMACV